MIRLLARRFAMGSTVCALSLLASCSQDSGAAQNVSSQMNQGALEMLNGHSSERIVIYHPDSGIGQYTLRLEKHSPCASNPCDAPAGQSQGALQLETSRGAQTPGALERWISVPQQFEVTRKDQDTAIILQNKGWYAEVRAVY
jgi:hypothetical protein